MTSEPIAPTAGSVAGKGTAPPMPTAGAAAPTTMEGVGTGGLGGTMACSITADATTSTAVPTVGIVTWSTDLTGVESARIEFGPVETGPTMAAPVDLNAPELRTLLLGMKQNRDYVYRIVVERGGQSCTSDDYMITTGMLSNVPDVQRRVVNESVASAGFIVTSVRVPGGGLLAGGDDGPAFIFDTDGDVVWAIDAPPGTSRARMSYDGQDMWLLALNVQNTGGEVRRVSMDGLEVEPNISGLSDAHHDFTVLPDGTVATMVWLAPGMNADNALVERAPDGTITTVVANLSTLYSSSLGYHPNAIHYHPADDSYTISDRTPNLFVKVTRQGQLLWQFGGTNPLGNHFPGDWQVNHGHHVLDNGNFLFFNNTAGFTQATALEYQLDESTWTATELWRYQTSQGSPTLGDVQRLPNGNTLVTASNAGILEEVDASGNVVQSFTTSACGYANFRESLYGPPPR